MGSARGEEGARVAPITYVGPDRRQHRPSFARLRASTAVFAVGGVLVVLAASFGLLGDSPRLSTAESATIVAALGNGAALILATLCAIVWHVRGRASDACLAAAMVLFGVGVVLLGHFPLSDPGHPASSEILVALQVASSYVTIGFFVSAALGPEVISVLRPSRTVLVGFAGVAALSLLLQAVPEALTALAPLSEADASVGRLGLGSLLVVILWAGSSVLLLWRGRARRDPLLIWMGGLAGVLALAEVARWPGVAPGVEAGGDLLRSGGLVLIVLGVSGYVVSIFAEQRAALLDAQETSQTVQGRLAEEHAARSELRHEARNALTSVSMATQTLQRSQERMDPAQREQLSTAICAEIERLERLLDPPAPAERTSVPLRRVVLAQAKLSAAAGMAITTEVPGHVDVMADEGSLAQVVANLLANARRHAPGSPVMLRAVEDNGGVVLRCEDRGPGVPAGEHERIFARGIRGRHAPASSQGLGLHVAARLVRQQGGLIWVEDRPGGGASFALWLPTLPARVTDLTEGSLPPAEGDDEGQTETRQGGLAQRQGATHSRV